MTDPPGDTAYGEFYEVDSAGVVLSITAGARARRLLGWSVDARPNLELGGALRPGEEFYDVGGVRQLPNGLIVVLDGASRELRFFGAGGTLAHRIGRRGQGPGEFEQPVLVPSVMDSVVVWDRHLARMHFFAGDGSGFRLIVPPNWVLRLPPLGLVGARALVSEPVGMIPLARGVYEGPRIHWWIDLESGVQLRVDSLMERRGYLDTTPNGTPLLMRIPFEHRAAAVVRGERALLARTARPEIGVYDLRGSMVRIMRIDEARLPVTDGALDEYYGSYATEGRSPAFLRQFFSGAPIPDSVPAFHSLLVDEEGLLWAARYQWDDTRPQEWVLFDKRGQALGAVHTPAKLEVHQVGVDFILGVTRDSMNVERVARYGLRRVASTPQQSN